MKDYVFVRDGNPDDVPRPQDPVAAKAAVRTQIEATSTWFRAHRVFGVFVAGVRRDDGDLAADVAFHGHSEDLTNLFARAVAELLHACTTGMPPRDRFDAAIDHLKAMNVKTIAAFVELLGEDA